VTSFSFHFQFCPDQFNFLWFYLFTFTHLSGILSLSYLSYFVLLSQHPVSSIHIHHFSFPLHLSPAFHLRFCPITFTLILCRFLSLYPYVPFPFTLPICSILSHSPIVSFPFTLPNCLVSFHSPNCLVSFRSPHLFRFLSLSPFVSFPFTLPICSVSFHPPHFFLFLSLLQHRHVWMPSETSPLRGR
jgi:hypothetical protein